MRPPEVLLVDDNPADTDLTSEVLARTGSPSHIHAVTDGVEAMAFLRREGKYADALLPDLVILDLSLPKKDGRTVLAEVKADPVLRRIPVVILTTSKAEEDILRSYDLGANSYITKPVTFQGLAEAMKALSIYWFEIVKLPSGL